jgi:hypothetical protein
VRLCTNATDGLLEAEIAASDAERENAKVQGIWKLFNRKERKERGKVARQNLEEAIKKHERGETVSPVIFCARMLPNSWTSEDVSALCGHPVGDQVFSNSRAESVVQCALGAAGPTQTIGFGPKFSRQQVIELCRKEIKAGAALKCAKAAATEAAGRGKRLDDMELSAFCGSLPEIFVERNLALRRAADSLGKVHRVGDTQERQSAYAAQQRGGHAKPLDSEAQARAGGEAGKCFAQLTLQAASKGSNGSPADAGVVARFCAGVAPLSRVSCLHAARRKSLVLSHADVDTCLGQFPRLAAAKLLKFHAEHNEIRATAGQWFSLTFQSLDQWNNLVDDTDLAVSISINDDNDQGAVLWGMRTNRTHGGVFSFSHLVISQPGLVEVRISTSTLLADGSYLRDRIATFQLSVAADPELPFTQACLLIFRESMSPAPAPRGKEDWEALHPLHRGWLSSQWWPQVFACEATLAKWHVQLRVSAWGDFSAEYRAGIDAIWTGRGLPTHGMTYEQVLGVSSSLAGRGDEKKKETAHTDEPATPEKARSSGRRRQVRRAYYKRSLEWHPDRWAGMPIYLSAVQGVFQLISEAYETLSGPPT